MSRNAKCDVRSLGFERVQRRHAVADSRDDAQLRPQGLQQLGQFLGQERFVLGEHGSRAS